MDPPVLLAEPRLRRARIQNLSPADSPKDPLTGDF